MKALCGLLALLLCAGAHAAESGRVEVGTPAWAALKAAAERTGDTSPAGEKLKRGQPLGLIEARQLQNVLMLNGRLMSGYKKDLESAFPRESEAFGRQYLALQEDLKELQKRIGEVSARLDVFEANMKRGLLNTKSRPSLLFNVGVSIFSTENLSGLMKKHSRSIGGGGGTWTSWTLGGEGYEVHYDFNIYPGYLALDASHMGVFLDTEWLPGIEVEVADEYIYPSLSYLIFSGSGGYDDDFGNLNELTGRSSLTSAGAVRGARGAQSFYIQRKTSGDWWPFSTTQIVASQTYDHWWGQKMNDLACKLNLRGLPMFWPFERAELYMVTLWSANDIAELNGWGKPNMNRQNSTGQSVGSLLQVAGGGTLYLEAATAEWQTSALPDSFRDYAFMATASKSLGPVAVSGVFEHVGTGFFPGGTDVAGNMSDPSVDESRPGRTNPRAWRTNFDNANIPSINGQTISLGATYDFPWFNMGVTAGSVKQTEASGPWLRGTHVTAFDVPNQNNAERRHGFTTSIDPAKYNRNSGIADSNGNTYNVDWLQLFSRHTEEIILTKTGLGDMRLKDDSVKYVNGVETALDINLESLFSLSRPALIKLRYRLRNVDEALSPLPGDKPLIVVDNATAIVSAELPWDTSLVLAGSLENWASKASFFPIEYHTDWCMVDVNFKFPKLLSGFSIGPFWTYMTHQDSYDGRKYFEGWSMGMGSSTTY